MLIFDESARYIKNPRAGRTKAAIYLSDRKWVKCRLILTGTPIADKPLDIWSQFRVLDGGKAFSQSFYTFRHFFFDEIRRGQWKEYRLKSERHKQIITKTIKKCCIRKTKEECLDLPERIFEVVEVKMSPELKRLYKTIEEKVLDEIEIEGKQMTIKNILTKLLRLQQITGGFIKTDQGTETKLDYTPKLDALVEQIEMIIDNGSSVVVWCRFLKSMDIIAEELKRRKIRFITMSGRDGKKKDQLWQKFQNSDIPVFISQIQAGGEGIDLFKKHEKFKDKIQYCIFYENMWSLDWRLQAQDRIHRIGQENTCIYKDLVVKGTIDERILQVIKTKKKVADWIMEEGIESILGRKK